MAGACACAIGRIRSFHEVLEECPIRRGETRDEYVRRVKRTVSQATYRGMSECGDADGISGPAARFFLFCQGQEKKSGYVDMPVEMRRFSDLSGWCETVVKEKVEELGFSERIHRDFRDDDLHRLLVKTALLGCYLLVGRLLRAKYARGRSRPDQAVINHAFLVAARGASGAEVAELYRLEKLYAVVGKVIKSGQLSEAPEIAERVSKGREYALCTLLHYGGGSRAHPDQETVNTVFIQKVEEGDLAVTDILIFDPHSAGAPVPDQDRINQAFLIAFRGDNECLLERFLVGPYAAGAPVPEQEMMNIALLEAVNAGSYKKVESLLKKKRFARVPRPDAATVEAALVAVREHNFLEIESLLMLYHYSLGLCAVM